MPRANKHCCEEKVKLTLRKLGHAKCSYDRKPHEKEGMWLNDVIGKKSLKRGGNIESATNL